MNEPNLVPGSSTGSSLLATPSVLRSSPSSSHLAVRSLKDGDDFLQRMLRERYTQIRAKYQDLRLRNRQTIRHMQERLERLEQDRQFLYDRNQQLQAEVDGTVRQAHSRLHEMTALRDAQVDVNDDLCHQLASLQTQLNRQSLQDDNDFKKLQGQLRQRDLQVEQLQYQV
jgi:disulfide oxidoreductase YuzD